MKTELLYLTYVTTFTGILWIPYILDRLVTRGLMSSVGYPENPKPQSPWAQRMMKAHANAIENLVIFAVLVLIANATGISNDIIGTASKVYFATRVVHAVAYTCAIPWLKTLSFAVGFAAQAAIAVQILSH